MSELYVYLHGADDGDDGPFYLTRMRDWAGFMEWAEALPHHDKFQKIRQLAVDGETSNTEVLSKQLMAALRDYPPDDCIKGIAQDLLDNIGIGRPEEMATISDE
jgi:hypothetical protein